MIRDGPDGRLYDVELQGSASIVVLLRLHQVRGMEFDNPLYASICRRGLHGLDKPVSVVGKEILSEEERAIAEDVRKNDRHFLVRRQTQFSQRHLARKDCLVVLRADHAEPILRLVARKELVPNLLAVFRVPRNRAELLPRVRGRTKRMVSFVAGIVTLENQAIALVSEIPCKGVNSSIEREIEDFALP